MARRGWFRYMKESSGHFDYFRRLAVEGAEVGLKVLEGEEPHIAKGLLAGAVGIVPVCANYEPATYLAAYRGPARDEAALVRLQERIPRFASSYSSPVRCGSPASSTRCSSWASDRGRRFHCSSR